MRCRPLLWLVLVSFLACAPRVALREPANVAHGLRVVRAGHATTWVDVAGFRILTDPIFLGWLWMLRRHDELGLDPANLPPVDAVLISHSHMDHYDPWSIAQVPGNRPVLFPAATTSPVQSGQYFLRMVEGKHTRELPWWRSVVVRNLEGKEARITAVPAAHWGGRLGLDGLWGHTYGGWVIESGGYTVYFAGDTGWDEEMFRSIAARFPRIDLALLPIGPVMWKTEAGASEERMTRHHINPPQALKAFEILRAAYFVPIHYGAFFQSPLRPDVPLEWLTELLSAHPAAARVAVLEPGRVWELPHGVEMAGGSDVQETRVD